MNYYLWKNIIFLLIRLTAKCRYALYISQQILHWSGCKTQNISAPWRFFACYFQASPVTPEPGGFCLLLFQKEVNGAEVPSHNRIIGNFMVYQDRPEANLLQVFAYPTNSEWLCGRWNRELWSSSTLKFNIFLAIFLAKKVVFLVSSG